MPDTDLDTELARLRDDMRGSLPVPGFDQIVARHKQRVIRRRMQVGAVVAVLVVSLAIPLLRDQMVPAPPDVATPPTSSGLTPPGPFITSAEFADADHGYAVRTKCTVGPRKCTNELLATDDGRHWKKRDMPRPDTVPSWGQASLNVLGREEITIDWPLSPSLETTQASRWHSLDGGETWQQVDLPVVVTNTVATIPDDGVLAQSCLRASVDGKQCEERGFVVVQPGSGKSAKLANQPPLTAMMAGSVPTADGIWWVAGRDPDTDHWGLAVSRDDGRTWTTSVLDWGEPVYSYGWSVGSQGGTLYATAIGALPAESSGLLAVFQSTDGGRSWEQTWQPRTGKDPRRVYPSTVVGADGSLTINGLDGKQYRSHDGGHTFTKVEARFNGYVEQSRIGYVAAGEEGTVLMTSEDGLRWRQVEVR